MRDLSVDTLGTSQRCDVTHPLPGMAPALAWIAPAESGVHGSEREMAARKKGATTRAPADGHGSGVVVEQMQAHFRVFGEALAGLGARVDAGFAETDRRFEAIGRRFDDVDRRFDRLEGDMAFVKTAVIDSARETRAIRDALDRKVDRDEVEGIVDRVLARRGR
jgi:hypothetical protein